LKFKLSAFRSKVSLFIRQQHKALHFEIRFDYEKATIESLELFPFSPSFHSDQEI
jgi:hypothetical protein